MVRRRQDLTGSLPLHLEYGLGSRYIGYPLETGVPETSIPTHKGKVSPSLTPSRSNSLNDPSVSISHRLDSEHGSRQTAVSDTTVRCSTPVSKAFSEPFRTKSPPGCYRVKGDSGVTIIGGVRPLVWTVNEVSLNNTDITYKTLKW